VHQKFTYHQLITEGQLDSFGHVNNAKYLEIFEAARWDFITSSGFGLAVVKAEMIGPVIMDVHIKYKRELNNREEIKVVSQCLEVKNRMIITLQQEIINQEGRLASHAIFSVGLMDLECRKLITMTPRWLVAMGIDIKEE
jgi:YbgC/YbaW family acyl-CoA thioester hydrolase